jgi:3-methyladenine DNA glycosylase AlkD
MVTVRNIRFMMLRELGSTIEDNERLVESCWAVELSASLLYPP